MVRAIFMDQAGQVLASRDFESREVAQYWIDLVVTEERFGKGQRWVDEIDARCERIDLESRAISVQEQHGFKQYLVTGDYTIDVIEL